MDDIFPMQLFSEALDRAEAALENGALSSAQLVTEGWLPNGSPVAYYVKVIRVDSGKLLREPETGGLMAEL